MNGLTAKEFLSQAFYLDKRITSNLEQIRRLEELVTRATSTMTATRISGTSGHSNLENAVSNMVDLRDEINADIDKIVEVKRKIANVISKVENPKYRLVLENKYLNLLSWKEIATKMNYSWRQIHRIHSEALKDGTLCHIKT